MKLLLLPVIFFFSVLSLAAFVLDENAPVTPIMFFPNSDNPVGCLAPANGGKIHCSDKQGHQVDLPISADDGKMVTGKIVTP